MELFLHQDYKKAGAMNISYAWLLMPTVCPQCHYGIEPVQLYSHYDEETNKIFNIYFCTLCGKPFIGEYSDLIDAKANASKCLAYPKTFLDEKFDDYIQKLSPSFCEIYSQSRHAEEIYLGEVAGMGYRKALEFLIKDYCIYRNPDNKDKIKKESLGEVIKKYIDNKKIQNSAKMASWIGNDETHYIRKWEDKDIEDLKIMIDLTLHFISMEMIYDDYSNDMLAAI